MKSTKSRRRNWIYFTQLVGIAMIVPGCTTSAHRHVVSIPKPSVNVLIEFGSDVDRWSSYFAEWGVADGTCNTISFEKLNPNSSGSFTKSFQSGNKCYAKLYQRISLDHDLTLVSEAEFDLDAATPMFDWHIILPARGSLTINLNGAAWNESVDHMLLAHGPIKSHEMALRIPFQEVIYMMGGSSELTHGSVYHIKSLLPGFYVLSYRSSNQRNDQLTRLGIIEIGAHGENFVAFDIK